MLRSSLVLIALAGCFHPVVPEGAPCAVDTECPSPQICDVGRCRRTPIPDGGVPGDLNGDGSTSDGSLIDATIPVCSQPTNLGNFADPKLIASLSNFGADGTPSITGDQLEMYFKSNRGTGGGAFKIYRTTRASLQNAWAPPAMVTELASGASEGSPDLSADRLTIYFSSTRAGGLGMEDIWRATRPTTSSMWSAPVHVPELSTAGYEEGFTVLPSGLVGYLHSSRGTGGTRVLRTTRPSTSAPWSPPVDIAELDGDNEDQNPSVTPDDCAMYFQSNRTGTQGADDLYFSSRTTPTGVWSSPVRIPNLNTGGFDADPWISADQRYIVFTTGPTYDGLDLSEARR